MPDRLEVTRVTGRGIRCHFVNLNPLKGKTMSTSLRGLLLLVFSVALGSPVCGQLQNLGPSGEYFYDTSTGLYWYDPAQWVGQSRATIDTFVLSSPIWNWATSAQITALNGKSAPAGFTLVSVMGAAQYTLSTGGPRWIGYHASAVAPDGWLAQSAAAPFSTIDATGFQNNVVTWGPGAWLVSTSSPVTSLILSQPQGSGSLQVQCSGAPAAAFAGAVYFTAFSFHPANATAPGLGWWQGLHISFPDVIGQFQTGTPPFIGTLNAAGVATFTLPPGTLSPALPDAYAVTIFFDVTLTNQLGVTQVATLNIM